MAEAATKLPIKTEKKFSATTQERWSPFEALHRDIGRLFDNFHPLGGRRSPQPSLFDLQIEWPRPTEWEIAPAMDLVERENGYEISAELPGLDENTIEIKLSNSTLTIKGEKTEEKEERENEYYLSERRFGSFHRSVRLPEGVDVHKIGAKFVRGVLTVTLPKSAEAKNNEKKISVKAA